MVKNGSFNRPSPRPSRRGEGARGPQKIHILAREFSAARREAGGYRGAMIPFRELSPEELDRVTGGEWGFRRVSDPLDRQRDPLAHADAHGGEGIAAAAAAELVHRGRD